MDDDYWMDEHSYDYWVDEHSYDYGWNNSSSNALWTTSQNGKITLMAEFFDALVEVKTHTHEGKIVNVCTLSDGPVYMFNTSDLTSASLTQLTAWAQQKSLLQNKNPKDTVTYDVVKKKEKPPTFKSSPKYAGMYLMPDSLSTFQEVEDLKHIKYTTDLGTVLWDSAKPMYGDFESDHSPLKESAAYAEPTIDKAEWLHKKPVEPMETVTREIATYDTMGDPIIITVTEEVPVAEPVKKKKQPVKKKPAMADDLDDPLLF